MPKIIPIKELKNTSEISEMCHKSDEPVYVTKLKPEIMNQRQEIGRYKPISCFSTLLEVKIFAII